MKKESTEAEDEDFKLRTAKRAEDVDSLKAKIPKCDVCGQDTQYVLNQTEYRQGTPPALLMDLQTHFTCRPIRVLERVVTEQQNAINAISLRLGEPKESLRARIRTGLRVLLFALGDKL